MFTGKLIWTAVRGWGARGAAYDNPHLRLKRTGLSVVGNTAMESDNCVMEERSVPNNTDI